MFYTSAALILAAASGFSFIYGLNQQVGSYFIFLLVLSLLLFAPLPIVVYRAYALLTANYRLERDGLRMRWGLRAEDIPLPEIEWVRRPQEIASALPIPAFSTPGAVLGKVNARDLGTLEYLASTTKGLLLIATPYQVYAISPENPDEFLSAFQQTLEMGSLTPIEPASVLPAAYISHVWSDGLARRLLVIGILLTLMLFIGISLAIPLRASVSLGFASDGSPLPPVPSAQMLLLPILGTFIFVADLATGLFFFRRDETRTIAYLVWISGVLSSLLFLVAAVIILA